MSLVAIQLWSSLQILNIIFDFNFVACMYVPEIAAGVLYIYISLSVFVCTFVATSHLLSGVGNLNIKSNHYWPLLHILTCRQNLCIIITDCDPLPLGGRNVTLALQSRTGHTQLRTVVGMLVFSQFWFWFPFTHFLSLAFTPTAIIGLNGQLKVTFYFYYLMSSLFLSLF